MASVAKIHEGKTPKRVHYIKEWMEKLGLEPKDITEATGADKSTISRWFAGNVPSEKYLDQLVELFHLDERAGLFRDPDDDWIARFYRERDAEGKERFLRAVMTEFGIAGNGTDGLRLHTTNSESFEEPKESSAKAGQRGRRNTGK